MYIFVYREINKTEMLMQIWTLNFFKIQFLYLFLDEN